MHKKSSLEPRSPILPFTMEPKRCATSGLARTTNAVECWHYGIQSDFSGSLPSIWKVIANLQKDAYLQKT